jgi:Domain of unknown function (DUF6046)
MQFSIPVSTLFTQVFGISSALVKTYKIDTEDNKNYSPNYQIKVGQEITDPDNKTSQLGTPVQFPMAFNGDYQYNYRVDGKIKKKPMKGLWLPYTSVASFSRAKRITETYMSGQNGSIIEEYGFEPWEIRIQGFIIKNDKSSEGIEQTVEDQIRDLQEWEGLSDAISVKGRGFEIRNIHKAALLSITYPEARNSNIEVICPYEMRLRSVEPFELINL